VGKLSHPTGCNPLPLAFQRKNAPFLRESRTLSNGRRIDDRRGVTVSVSQ
jgi:hypothetical protein